MTSLDEAVRLAGKAFVGGGTSYFLVLQTTTQYLDARVQEIQLVADVRRAAASLDRSVGRNVTWPQLPMPEPEVEAETVGVHTSARTESQQAAPEWDFRETRTPSAALAEMLHNSH